MLGKEDTSPHFVAVEWEQSVFEQLVQWRPWVESELRRRWSFLGHEDSKELSRALAWEADAHTERFPGVDRLWLEAGWQQAEIERRAAGSVDDFLRGLARCMLEQLVNPGRLTMSEFLANAAPPPDPVSKHELINRVSRRAWSEATESWGPHDSQRDARWADGISQRSVGLRGGWIAIAVGWAHADPAGGRERLGCLLASRGFRVNSVCLAPDGFTVTRADEGAR